ncbi:MAG TPA: LptF/LptG family permease [Geminicoccaceae bacterium]|nr:LptF/LptG family permease [Geminicoccaceae bacterium]
MLSIFSRYIARMLLARTLILLAGLAALMVVLAFLADGDQVLAASDGVWLPMLRYTVLRLPEILAQMLPITAVLAGLLTFAELVRHSELTAMHAAGVSKPRLAAAVLPVALLIALVQFVIEDQAVPAAIGALRAWGIGDYGSAGDAPAVSWLRHRDDIVRIQRLDAASGELGGVTIFRRDPEGNLIAEIEAASASYEGGAWQLRDVTRSWVGTGAVDHEARLSWAGDLEPALLAAVIAHPRETPLRQLMQVNQAPGLGTQPSYRYKLWLQERLAAPATTVAMILVVVALARPPGGRSPQGWLIGMGVAVGFLCWTFDGLVLAIGDLGLVPPALAAWTPLLVFATIAASVIVHQERHRTARRPAGAAVILPKTSSG